VQIRPLDGRMLTRSIMGSVPLNYGTTPPITDGIEAFGRGGKPPSGRFRPLGGRIDSPGDFFARVHGMVGVGPSKTRGAFLRGLPQGLARGHRKLGRPFLRGLSGALPAGGLQPAQRPTIEKLRGPFPAGPLAPSNLMRPIQGRPVWQSAGMAAKPAPIVQAGAPIESGARVKPS
jgi:hypothetical protein